MDFKKELSAERMFERYLEQPVTSDLEKKREEAFENAIEVIGEEAVKVLSDLQYAAMEAAFHAGVSRAADLIMKGVA